MLRSCFREGSQLKEIGDMAFQGCHRLQEITLPETLEHIGKCCFKMTGLKRIAIPQSVRHIGDDAFGECRKLNITGAPAVEGQLAKSERCAAQ